MTPLLEVCVDSLASARAAIAGGADRLELCSALAVGGLSPYAELLRQIRAEAPSIPVRCLMRPRPGDFLYEPEEIELLCAQMPALRRAGADGFVIGALTPDGELDRPAVRKMMAAAGAGASIGGKLVGALKGVIAAAGLGAALGKALTEGAALEQSLGGVETLFKDSADQVIAAADNVYRTAGVSAYLASP